MKTSDYFSGKTVNIPYVTGDRYGLLTEELVYQLSVCGLLEYKPSTADLKLEVEIVDTTNDQIGYRKDRNPDGTLKKNLMPTESRQKVNAKVSLISNLDKEVIWGPKIISADVDYDYVEQDSLRDLSFLNAAGVRQTVLSFSLGQMESVGSAQDSALIPLYRRLAENIVDAIVGELKEEGF